MVSDYEFYQTRYFGKLLTSEEFPEYATKADGWLNELTYGKYSSPDLSDSQLNAVKMAECSLADLCFTQETEAASNPSISKETVGDHSVTYRTGTDSTSVWSVRIYDTAARYLLTTGLLYRGAILKFTL